MPLYSHVSALLDQGNNQLYQEIVGSLIYLSAHLHALGYCIHGDAAYSSNESSKHYTPGGGKGGTALLTREDQISVGVIVQTSVFTLRGCSGADHSDELRTSRSVSGLHVHAGRRTPQLLAECQEAVSGRTIIMLI